MTTKYDKVASILFSYENVSELRLLFSDKQLKALEAHMWDYLDMEQEKEIQLGEEEKLAIKGEVD